MTRKFLFLASAAVGAALMISPTGLKAATHSCTCAREAAQTPDDVAKELDQFKFKAFQVRREAGVLKSFTPNKQMHWKSHTAYLGTLKDHVNDLGRALARLEEMKSVATESQQMAIENARPHLVVIADQLGSAINSVNENRSSVKWSPYSETVTGISSHADSLYEKLDTILSYENVQARLNSLELVSQAGS